MIESLLLVVKICSSSSYVDNKLIFSSDLDRAKGRSGSKTTLPELLARDALGDLGDLGDAILGDLIPLSLFFIEKRATYPDLLMFSLSLENLRLKSTADFGEDGGEGACLVCSKSARKSDSVNPLCSVEICKLLDSMSSTAFKILSSKSTVNPIFSATFVVLSFSGFFFLVQPSPLYLLP